MTREEFRELFDPRVTLDNERLVTTWSNCVTSLTTGRTLSSNQVLTPAQTDAIRQMRNWCVEIMKEAE